MLVCYAWEHRSTWFIFCVAIACSWDRCTHSSKVPVILAPPPHPRLIAISPLPQAFGALLLATAPSVLVVAFRHEEPRPTRAATPRASGGRLLSRRTGRAR
jgi:hypothetical protein